MIPRSVNWWPSLASKCPILPSNWGLPSSAYFFDNATVLSPPVFTCVFTLQLFIEIFSCKRFVFLINILICDAVGSSTDEIIYSSRNYSVYCSYLNLDVVCFYTFWQCPIFSSVVFFTLRWTKSIRMWLTCTDCAHNFAFINSKFFYWFSKLYLYSSFTLKGIVPDEELAKTIAWLVNWKLSVISVTNIAGFTLIQFRSSIFASGSVNLEIIIFFTNSSLEFFEVTIECFFASSLRRARKLSSDSPTTLLTAI